METPWRPAALVTGGREVTPSAAHGQWFMHWLLAVQPAFLVNGGARGVDLWADAIARALGIVVHQFLVSEFEWCEHKGAAGAMRNSKMLEVMIAHGGAYCVVFEGGSGTADMKQKAEKAGLSMIDMQTPSYRPPSGQRDLW